MKLYTVKTTASQTVTRFDICGNVVEVEEHKKTTYREADTLKELHQIIDFSDLKPCEYFDRTSKGYSQTVESADYEVTENGPEGQRYFYLWSNKYFDVFDLVAKADALDIWANGGEE